MSGFLTYKYFKSICSGCMNFKMFYYKKSWRYYRCIWVTVVMIALPSATNASVNLLTIFASSLLLHSYEILNSQMLNYPLWYISTLLLCYVIFYIFAKMKIGKAVFL